VSPVDLRRLDPVPPGRVCTGCGGGLRFSHITYLGRGERVAVHVCRNCGLAYRGGVREDAPAGSGGGQHAPRGGEPTGGRDRSGGHGRDTRRRGGEPALPERRRKPLPDEGRPDNPVIDEAMARRLREALGGDGS
jgi:hypothetical protein